VAFVVKSGAIRIARDGITVRPFAEDALMLKKPISHPAAAPSSKVPDAMPFNTSLSKLKSALK
jgi:hypothetical protein